MRLIYAYILVNELRASLKRWYMNNTGQRPVKKCIFAIFNLPESPPDRTGRGKIVINMSQSLAQMYVHLVFSTKHREHLISPSIQKELYSYMAGILKNIECTPLQIGGTDNHVHVLCCLSKKIALIKLMEEIKRSSSKWIKTKDNHFKNFFWQDGYGAFSIGYTQISEVIKYILYQDEHHRKISFQEEYRQFLKKYNMEYDERYVWD